MVAHTKNCYILHSCFYMHSEVMKYFVVEIIYNPIKQVT